MRKRSTFSLLSALAIPTLVFAQNGPATQPSGAASNGPPAGEIARVGFGGDNLETLKVQLKASDEEWKVLAPMLRKLMVARRAAEARAVAGATGPAMGFGGFGRGGPGGRGGGNDAFDGPMDGSGSGGRGRRGFGPGGSGPDGRGDFGPDGRGGGFGPDGGFGPGGQGRRGFGNNEDSDRGPTTQPGGGFQGRGMRGGPDGFGGPGMGGPGMGGGGFGGPPGMGGGTNAVSQAMNDLQTTLADSKASPNEIAEKVAVVRKARNKAREELDKVLKELTPLLTPDQQAILVGMGYLD